MAVLETTFLVDLLRGKEEIVAIKEELKKTEETLAIAAPSIMELWTGAEMSKIPQLEKIKINELLTAFLVLPLDEKSAKRAGEIEAELLHNGIKIETEDLMIAGIASSNGEKVVTRDTHYTQIAGLAVLKY